MKLNKSIIGMIHLSGYYPVERALEEIKIYEDCGLFGALVENYHSGVEDVIETLKLVKTNINLGVNILPNEYQMAFKIANDYGCKFIQLDFISGRYERNKSIDIDDYMKYRDLYPDIFVMGGVWPKYYVPVKGSNLSYDLTEATKLCDAVVVTGQGTGKETPIEKIKRFKEVLGDFPIVIGAGINSENIKDQMQLANGAIIGSSFKPSNNTTIKVDKELVKDIVSKL